MKLVTPSLVILTALVVGGMVFKTTAPTHCGTVLESDSIFVLTGDPRRIPFAMKKLNESNAKKLYIIGAGAKKQKNKDNRIITESESKSTYQNSVVIKKIATDENLYRLVLITSIDHFNRAKYLVAQQLPDVTIVPCAVNLDGTPTIKRLLRWGIEYAKYIGTIIGLRE